MTFRTVLNKILSGNGVVLPMPGDLADAQGAQTTNQPRTSQSEIINLFAEELRGRDPINISDAKDEDRRVTSN